MTAPFLEFFSFYWTRPGILAATVAVAAVLAALFGAFKLSRDSGRRSRILLASIGVSSSFWAFTLFSFAFCAMLADMYWDAPVLAVKLSALSALAASALIAPASVFALRGRAARQMSFLFFNSKVGGELLSPEERRNAAEASSNMAKIYERVSGMFSALSSRIGSPSAKVEVVTTCSACRAIEPFSAAFDWKENRIVAISESVAQSLEDDELEAVLAHELAHLKSKDALQKTAATAYKMAFPFDPLSHFVEAALYRERELAADEFAANATSKPEALASALLKIYEMGRSGLSIRSPLFSSLSILRGDSGILSKQPRLNARIKRLLVMSEKKGSQR